MKDVDPWHGPADRTGRVEDPSWTDAASVSELTVSLFSSVVALDVAFGLQPDWLTDVQALKTRLLALVLVLLAEEITLSSRSSIRDAGTPQQGSPSAIFKTGVDLVALSVIVKDTDQKFVPGLTATDFAVYEDGVQRSGDVRDEVLVFLT